MRDGHDLGAGKRLPAALMACVAVRVATSPGGAAAAVHVPAAATLAAADRAPAAVQYTRQGVMAWNVGPPTAFWWRVHSPPCPMLGLPYCRLQLTTQQ